MLIANCELLNAEERREMEMLNAEVRREIGGPGEAAVGWDQSAQRMQAHQGDVWVLAGIIEKC
jgi:hypothetical protein